MTGTSNSAGEESDSDEGSVDDLPLIDVHAHVSPREAYGQEPVSVDAMVEWMDDRGIDRSVLLTLESPESFPVTVPSWWILEQAREYPDRFIPFCTVDPRSAVFGEDTVVDKIQGFVEEGAQGFGELKVGVPIDDERLDVVYETCADQDLPILIHMDDKAMIDDVGLPGLEDVLASFPDVDFVVHAQGWWAHITADVSESDLGERSTAEIEPGGRVDELLSDYENVYGDLSAPAGWNALTRDESYAQEFLERHHGQLVFGTDYFYRGQSIPQFDLFERFDLSEDAWANVRYENADDLV